MRRREFGRREEAEGRDQLCKKPQPGELWQENGDAAAAAHHVSESENDGVLAVRVRA